MKNREQLRMAKRRQDRIRKGIVYAVPFFVAMIIMNYLINVSAQATEKLEMKYSVESLYYEDEIETEITIECEVVYFSIGEETENGNIVYIDVVLPNGEIHSFEEEWYELPKEKPVTLICSVGDLDDYNTYYFPECSMNTIENGK